MSRAAALGVLGGDPPLSEVLCLIDPTPFGQVFRACRSYGVDYEAALTKSRSASVRLVAAVAMGCDEEYLLAVTRRLARCLLDSDTLPWVDALWSLSRGVNPGAYVQFVEHFANPAKTAQASDVGALCSCYVRAPRRRAEYAKAALITVGAHRCRFGAAPTLKALPVWRGL